MKKYYLFLLSVIGLTILTWPQENHKVDFSAIVGLKFCYTSLSLQDTDGNNQNTVRLNTINLELSYELFEDFFVKGIAGYSMRSFSKPVNFTQLPQALQWDNQTFNSMLFGVGAWSDPLYWKRFSLGFEIDLLFYRLFQREAVFVDPAVSGHASIENSFLQLTINLLLQYDGLDSIILFAGPSVNLLSGTVLPRETVLGQEYQEELNLGQSRVLGLIVGAYWLKFEHFDLELRLGLFSSFSLSLGILYEF